LTSRDGVVKEVIQQQAPSKCGEKQQHGANHAEQSGQEGVRRYSVKPGWLLKTANRRTHRVLRGIDRLTKEVTITNRVEGLKFRCRMKA